MNEEIIKVLKNVAQLKGIICVDDFEHEIGYEAEHINDYLAIGVLAELLESGKAEIVFKTKEPDERISYLLKLLKEREEK